MIIVLLGASGSGKSTIETELAAHHGYNKIISYTTRAMRPGEQNGKDYYFISNEQFDEMKKLGAFAEFDEYSQGRMYGTLRADYQDGNRVVVVTPNGYRKIKEVIPKENILTVLVEASLGTRIKRYIDRCGTDQFNFDDAGEIFARINRDFGMFLGLENEVDLIVYNDEGVQIGDIVSQIVSEGE